METGNNYDYRNQNSVKNVTSNFTSKLTNFFNDNKNSISFEICVALLICLIIYIVIYSVSSIRSKYSYNREDAPMILNGLSSGQYPREIKQNPNSNNSKTLLRSRNENGIEYCYSMWLYIDTNTWNANSSNIWRHIFHKGPKINNFSIGEPHIYSEIQCPGLWISPTENKLRLYVNTYSDTNEYVEISNMPVKKWIHFVYSQSNFTSKIYINGKLKTVHELLTLPRQNYYNLYLTQNDGFTGFLTTMQYFNYELTYSQILNITKKGPNLNMPKNDSYSQESINLSSNLPYLSNKWWVDDLTYN